MSKGTEKLGDALFSQIAGESKVRIANKKVLEEEGMYRRIDELKNKEWSYDFMERNCENVALRIRSNFVQQMPDKKRGAYRMGFSVGASG